jgi:hypothetical protein
MISRPWSPCKREVNQTHIRLSGGSKVPEKRRAAPMQHVLPLLHQTELTGAHCLLLTKLRSDGMRGMEKRLYYSSSQLYLRELSNDSGASQGAPGIPVRMLGEHTATQCLWLLSQHPFPTHKPTKVPLLRFYTTQYYFLRGH